MKTILIVLFLVMLVRTVDVPKSDSGTAAADCKITTSLQQGSVSDDVLCLERRLVALTLHSDDANKTFGSTTRDEVIAYQTKLGLTIDGVVGPQTGSRLGIWGAQTAPATTTTPDTTTAPAPDSTPQTRPPVVATTPIPTGQAPISTDLDVIVTPETLRPVDLGQVGTATTSG